MIQELQTIMSGTGDMMNIDQFAKFVKNHQLLLFPAFKIQEKMREKVLGVSFWAVLMSRRAKDSHGRYVDLPLNTRKKVRLDY